MHWHTLLLPISLGLIAFCKTWIKWLLTKISPKLAILFLKNGVVIKLRDLVVGACTQFFVLSHKPWRRRIVVLKSTAAGMLIGVYRRYLASPLWVRTLIAIALILVTASSTWVMLALLMIPQPILVFMKVRGRALLSKIGVLRSLDVAWRRVVPGTLQSRWTLYRKWTLGRRQARAARRLRASVRTKLGSGPDRWVRRLPFLAPRDTDAPD